MNERFLFNSLEMFGVEVGSIFGSFLLWLISRYADYTYNMFIERRFAILPGAARQDLQAQRSDEVEVEGCLASVPRDFRLLFALQAEEGGWGEGEVEVWLTRIVSLGISDCCLHCWRGRGREEGETGGSFHIDSDRFAVCVACVCGGWVCVEGWGR